MHTNRQTNKNQSMGVAQVDYQAAEAAINLKRDDFLTASCCCLLLDQSEYPLWSCTNWERATNLSLLGPEKSSNSCPYINVWVAFQHVSENEESAYASSINVSTSQLFLLKKKNKQKPNRNSYSMLFCTAFLTVCYMLLYYSDDQDTSSQNYHLSYVGKV